MVRFQFVTAFALGALVFASARADAQAHEWRVQIRMSDGSSLLPTEPTTCVARSGSPIRIDCGDWRHEISVAEARARYHDIVTQTDWSRYVQRSGSIADGGPVFRVELENHAGRFQFLWGEARGDLGILLRDTFGLRGPVEPEWQLGLTVQTPGLERWSCTASPYEQVLRVTCNGDYLRVIQIDDPETVARVTATVANMHWDSLFARFNRWPGQNYHGVRFASNLSAGDARFVQVPLPELEYLFKALNVDRSG